MTEYSLTKTRFHEGVWQGVITAPDPESRAPEIAVTLRDRSLRGVTVAEMTRKGHWVLEVPVPLEAVGDGVHTFLISDVNSGSLLDSFTLIAGEVLGDDLRAEIDLLRAELDMLKRAFRRHCVETT